MGLKKGMGRFSKPLEASEDLEAVMDLEMWFRVLQDDEMEAISVGCRYGRRM